MNDDFDAGQRVWTADGVLCTIQRFYTTLPGVRRAVLYPVGADRADGRNERHADVSTLSAESEHGVGAAFGETVTRLEELSPGDLLYGGSITWQGEPNVLRVLQVRALPGEPEPHGFTWQFVNLAEPLEPRQAGDGEHFTWDFQLAAGTYRRADFLAGV